MNEKKKTSISDPTRQTIERLFRNFEQHRDAGGHYEKYEALQRKMRDLVDAFEETPKFKALKKQSDDMYQKYRSDGEKFRARKQKVYRCYLARGLTPAVRKMIEELVDMFEGE